MVGTMVVFGVRGNGTVTNRGIAVGARGSNGACLAEKAPPGSSTTSPSR